MQLKSSLWHAESLHELSTLQKPVENTDKNLVTWLALWPVSSVTTSYFADEETAALNKKSSIWVQRLTRESESKVGRINWASWQLKVNIYRVLTMHASIVKISYILTYVNPQTTLWDVLSYF